MTPQQVSSIMKGNPDYRRFLGDREQWEYLRYSVASNVYVVILVNFEDGRVVGLNTFPDVESNRKEIEEHRIRMGN